MNKPRIMIAATASGSGKTTITCGLLAALKQRGLKPCSFKCGPDYIDPMYHRNVLGIESGNLDTFFTEDEVTRWIYDKEYTGDISVIEGVMGLFDGVRGVEETGSSYDLARVLNCPIILVVNAKGAGKSVVATLKGFIDYDKHKLIKGVILNKTSKSFGQILKPIIEQELGVKYLGTLSDISDINISSRHLGLYLPEEITDIKSQLSLLGNQVEEEIDVDAILEFANGACEDIGKAKAPKQLDTLMNSMQSVNTIKLAVARDEAFCFYYKENLELFESIGIKLCFFSPIKDFHLPTGISGILLGGGYPENHLKELSINNQIKDEIRLAYENGMPIMAECGGFMYLMDEIVDSDNTAYKMVSAINGKATFTGHLVRFGYAIIDDGERKIKGHEFHYYDTDNNGSDCKATKPSSTRSWQCIHKANGGFVGFPHLYYLSNPDFIKNFVEAMKNYGGY